ncbi:hypothetical protein NDI39_30695 [Microcoleus sp. ZQ-A2]|nr:hypothetical protein [Microcoleus sp. FACHB-1]
MTPQQFTRNSNLMPLVFKGVGWSATVAILLASGHALALTHNQAATTAPAQLSQHTILAQDVEEESQSQESSPDSEIKSSQEPRFRLSRGRLLRLAPLS